MSRSLVVHGDASLDVEEASLWYETECTGLGVRFLDELHRLFGRITEAPRQFPVIDEPVRRGLLRRFPFGVYYVHENDVVHILAVLHLVRRPGEWRIRLEEDV